MDDASIRWLRWGKAASPTATANGATEKARVAHDPAAVFAATVRSLVRADLRERQ